MRSLYFGFLLALAIILVFACGDDASRDPPAAPASPPLSASPPNTPVPVPSPSPFVSEGAVPLAIVNGTLIDGTGSPPVADAYVLVRDGVIEAAGCCASRIRIPSDYTIIDAGGGTIMPGLIDAHVHITRQIVRNDPAAGVVAVHQDGLLPWLRAGITTLRDVGTAPIVFPSIRYFVDGLEHNAQAPRVAWAGPIVTASGGYPVPVPRYALVAQEVASADEARDIVNKLADGGAAVIKLGLEKGYYEDLGWPLLDLEEVLATTETAHARGLRVTAHVTSADEVRLALNGGVDDLAHAPVESLPDALLEEMLAAGMGMATTATVWGPPEAERMAAENARRYADMGGTVAVATDFGCCDQLPGLPPYLEEMQFLRDAGMTPMQLIVAATHGGAFLSNAGDRVGTLQAGRIADILVVNGDPLTDLQALLNVRAVLKGGVRVKGSR